MLQALKALSSLDEVQGIFLLSPAEVGFELAQTESDRSGLFKADLGYGSNTAHNRQRRFSGTWCSQLSEHHAETQVPVIPAAQLESENNLSKTVLL